MNSEFRLEAVEEPPPPLAADRAAQILAANPTWVRPFLLLLDSIDFGRPPALTPAGEAFEQATGGEGSELLSAVTDLYGDVRDGFALTKARGDLLERFVWHGLARRFPERIASCRVLVDGAPQTPDFKFDAATRVLPPCSGIEAKASESALLPHPSRRATSEAKCRWVIDMRSESSERIAGVFATFAPEDLFRRMLQKLMGQDEKRAVVIAHGALRGLARRLEAIEEDLKPNVLH